MYTTYTPQNILSHLFSSFSDTIHLNNLVNGKVLCYFCCYSLWTLRIAKNILLWNSSKIFREEIYTSPHNTTNRTMNSFYFSMCVHFQSSAYTFYKGSLKKTKWNWLQSWFKFYLELCHSFCVCYIHFYSKYCPSTLKIFNWHCTVM